MGKTEKRPGASQKASEEGKLFSRRTFLDLGGKAFVAGRVASRLARGWPGRIVIGAAALGPGSELAELTKTESNVVILPGQEERFKGPEYEKVKNGVLVIGGATVQSSENIAKAITPGLEGLGPVMAVDWSHTGFNMKSLANDIERIQKEYGMRNLSLYFHSMGDIEAGMLMPLIADKIRVPMMIFDDSLVDLSDLKISRNSLLQAVEISAQLPSGEIPNGLIEGAKIFSRLPFGYLVSWAAEDGLYYHNLFNTGIATPSLLRAQLSAAENGAELIDPLARVAKRDSSITILLQPEHAQSDQVIDDYKAARDLKRRFPNILLYRISGDAGHANELQHPGPYNYALLNLTREFEPELKKKWGYTLVA